MPNYSYLNDDNIVDCHSLPKCSLVNENSFICSDSSKDELTQHPCEITDSYCQSKNHTFNFSCDSTGSRPRFFSPCKMNGQKYAICNVGSMYKIANVSSTIEYDESRKVGFTNNAVYSCDIPFTTLNTCNSYFNAVCKNGKKMIKCPNLADERNDVYLCGNSESDCKIESELIFYPTNLYTNSCETGPYTLNPYTLNCTKMPPV